MKHFIIFLLSFYLFPFAAFADDVYSAVCLVNRLIPSHASSFKFKQCNLYGECDFFRLESSDDKILITGNNANSMAMGLNHYLKYYCLTTVSWYADIPVEMPDSLPVLNNVIERKAKVDKRFFLNYCTYGYSMPFWKWRDWERLIDWMALNGINMPLAITGQEAVWYKVWKNVGLTDDEIYSYFTGPTYLPWHRMANIDSWNGPLPKQWLDTQLKLQKKILNRERELNMHPVLPAFAGHVPNALRRLYPNLNIQTLGKWAGFGEEYHSYFLNPNEPLFSKIQRMFLDEQTKLFGTDHIYGMDPFNEVDPPSWDPEYLRKVASDMYQTLSQVDSCAKWLQMTWMFYFDRKKWTKPRIEALLKGVPSEKLILLDYHCENVELWKKTDKFYGQPYIWCYLGNFGGNTTITGNTKDVGERLEKALIEGGKNLNGIGSTLEGLDVNQFPYEYIFDKAWSGCPIDSVWIQCLADRHVGKKSLSVRNAWQILFDDVFVQVPKTLGILPNLRPVFDNNHNKRTELKYSNKILYSAFKELLNEPIIERDAHRLDVIIVGRQLIGNKFLTCKQQFDISYKEKNLLKMNFYANLMRDMINDIDTLNAYHVHCSLSTWISAARSYGNTLDLKNYYEKNARNLITTWGGSLNDYANRSWSGLTSCYYYKRWDMYINALISSVESGQVFDQKKFDEEIADFENGWVNSTEMLSVTVVKEKLYDFAYRLLKKYE